MRWFIGLVVLSVFGLVRPASAAFEITTNDDLSLSLGGYARSLGGIQKIVYIAPTGAPVEILPKNHYGLSANIFRLEWKAALIDRFSAEIHQRLFLRVVSESSALNTAQLGMGASARPQRKLNLRSNIYNEDKLLLEHDIDRLVVRANCGNFDINMGRQAITWGEAQLFTTTDIWATFSPFEIDTTQKRGVDALRIIYSHSDAIEFDAIVADRGNLSNLSGGMRLLSYNSIADFYLAAAKNWRDLLGSLGVSTTIKDFKLRAEISQPYNIDKEKFIRPKISMGFDWLHPDFTLTLETHYNGNGVKRTEKYIWYLMTSSTISHQQDYLLGRWYAGSAASYKISELFSLAATIMSNLQDKSVILNGSFTYYITQETEISIGAYQGVGKKMQIAPVPQWHSEFGSYGSQYYVAMASFF
ncbi:MAG: hypothetical protein JW841_17050 [Deltaproteobacteria bacterium]|nr:hypothetical protein [Deltaproteobacteria bacterium]